VFQINVVHKFTIKSCACISIYRKEHLDESFRDILRKYQKSVIEDTCWFSIELEYHMKPTYTDNEKQQIIEAFGRFPEQEILIFGECDRIFVAVYEITIHFGGLLRVNLGGERATINSYPGVKNEIQQRKYKYSLNHEPDYWLVDHVFIRKYFAKNIEDNFQKFKLDKFLPYA
jgi:hypothetical protein